MTAVVVSALYGSARDSHKAIRCQRSEFAEMVQGQRVMRCESVLVLLANSGSCLAIYFKQNMSTSGGG